MFQETHIEILGTKEELRYASVSLYGCLSPPVSPFTHHESPQSCLQQRCYVLLKNTNKGPERFFVLFLQISYKFERFKLI